MASRIELSVAWLNDLSNSKQLLILFEMVFVFKRYVISMCKNDACKIIDANYVMCIFIAALLLECVKAKRLLIAKFMVFCSIQPKCPMLDIST